MDVVAPMCADFLHVGHIHLLECAGKLGKVTILLMTDEAMMTQWVKVACFFPQEVMQAVVGGGKT